MVYKGVIMFSSTKKWIVNFLYGIEEKQVGYWNKNKTPLLIKFLLVYVCVFIFVIGYALFVPNEDIEVVQGEGKVIPGRRFSQIQSEYDGKIKRILVKEGQHVKEGDFLMEISRKSSRGNEAIYKPKAVFSGIVYKIPLGKLNGVIKVKDALVEIIPDNTPLFAEAWFDVEDAVLLQENMPVFIKTGFLGYDKTEEYVGNIIQLDDTSIFNKRKNITERKVIVSIDEDLETPRSMGFRIQPGMEAIVGKKFKKKNWAYSVLEPFYMVKNWIG